MIQQKGNAFTDLRDGKVYRTVKIGSNVWMAENLSYDAPGSKCYNNCPEYGEKCGRLYDWETAKKAAPQGWHLPSNEEWDQLCNHFDNRYASYITDYKYSPYKAKEGWNKNCNGPDDYGNGNGTDDFGFSAIPCGYGNSSGDFFHVENYSFWWSASEYNEYNEYDEYDNEYDRSYAYIRYMGYYDHDTRYNLEDKRFLFSVRCVKECIPPT